MPWLLESVSRDLKMRRKEMLKPVQALSFFVLLSWEIGIRVGFPCICCRGKSLVTFLSAWRYKKYLWGMETGGKKKNNNKKIPPELSLWHFLTEISVLSFKYIFISVYSARGGEGDVSLCSCGVLSAWKFGRHYEVIRFHSWCHLLLPSPWLFWRQVGLYLLFPT